MEQAVTYKLSKGIRRAKARYVILSILLPTMLIAFIFLSPTTKDDNLATKAGIGVFALVMIGLIFYITSSIALRKLSELSVSIFPDRIERENRKHKEIFLWKDVQRAEILQYPNYEIATIKLSLANKKVVTLFGFEDMETAYKQIEKAIPHEVVINKKRVKLDWDQPFMITLIMLLTFAVILAIQLIGEQAYRFFNMLFSFGFGLYYLIAKPISNAQGKGWRIFEIIVSVFLIVSAILMLVFFPQ